MSVMLSIFNLLLIFLPFSAASLLLLLCAAKSKPKKPAAAKDMKKEKKPEQLKNKEASPKTTATMGPEGNSSNQQLKTEANDASSNEIVQQPPPVQDFPLLPKNRSTIICTLDGTSQAHTTSQVGMPRTLDSRTYQTEKTKEEAKTKKKETKTMKEQALTAMDMEPVEDDDPSVEAEDAIFTDVSGGCHGDDDETQKPSADCTQCEALNAMPRQNAAPKIVASTATATPKSCSAPVTTAQMYPSANQANPEAPMMQLNAATMVDSVPSASIFMKEPRTAQSTRA